MHRFEYLVVDVEHDRVLTTNGHWQGEIPVDQPDAAASCPSLFAWMQDAGAQGWELVAVDPEQANSVRLYLKRTHVR